jgi:hypothetical protein
VEREAKGEARRGNSPGPSVELTDTLPLVLQGHRVVRKRKAQEVESSRYEYAALFSYINIVAPDVFRLQSTRFSTRARAPRDGNGSSSFGDRIGYHCRGGHRATSWCHPAASNKYHGWDTTSHEGEEGCHEEVLAVSVHLVA